MIIVIFGPVGCGKSTVSRILADKLGACSISSDELRKKLAGIDPYRRVKSGFERGIYSPEFTEKVYRTMIEEALNKCAKGQRVIIDATFKKKRHRDMLKKEAERRGIPVHFFYLNVPEEEIKRRIDKRSREKSISDADWNVYLRMKKEFDPPEGAIVVDASKSPEETAKRIVDHIKKGVGNAV